MAFRRLRLRLEPQNLAQRLIHPDLPARPAPAQGGEHVGIEPHENLLLRIGDFRPASAPGKCALSGTQRLAAFRQLGAGELIGGPFRSVVRITLYARKGLVIAFENLARLKRFW